MGWRRTLPLPPFTFHPSSVPFGCSGSWVGLRRQIMSEISESPSFQTPSSPVKHRFKVNVAGAKETRAMDQTPFQKTDASDQGLVDAADMVNWLTQPSLPVAVGAIHLPTPRPPSAPPGPPRHPPLRRSRRRCHGCHLLGAEGAP